MQYSQGSVGRIFVLRLEHGDPMPATLEQFAIDQGVQSGMAILVGGIANGCKIVVGPRDSESMPPDPMMHILAGVHEVTGVGTLFPDESGRPSLHMHAALGRQDHTVSGCIRPGIETWQLAEVILIEIEGMDAARLLDQKTGFRMLTCHPPAPLG